MERFKQITILGIGLIGASLARSCREKNLADRLAGFGRNADNLKKAETLGIIDSGSTDLQTAVKDADLVVLCTPVGVLAERVREMIPFLQPGCLITDAGSVKGDMVREIDSILPDSIHFVGAHPIAGGEQSGLEASSADLLPGAQCIITPTSRTNSEALKAVSRFWSDVGMRTTEMDADEHDVILGAISHLPHVVAFALMNTVGEVKTENYSNVLPMSGGGLKDITRIASSEPVMWRDICMKNKKPVLELIGRFQANLENMKTMIEEDREEALQDTFAQANGHRGKLMETHS